MAARDRRQGAGGAGPGVAPATPKGRGMEDGFGFLGEVVELMNSWLIGGVVEELEEMVGFGDREEEEEGGDGDDS